MDRRLWVRGCAQRSDTQPWCPGQGDSSPSVRVKGEGGWGALRGFAHEVPPRPRTLPLALAGPSQDRTCVGARATPGVGAGESEGALGTKQATSKGQRTRELQGRTPLPSGDTSKESGQVLCHSDQNTQQERPQGGPAYLGSEVSVLAGRLHCSGPEEADWHGGGSWRTTAVEDGRSGGGGGAVGRTPSRARLLQPPRQPLVLGGLIGHGSDVPSPTRALLVTRSWGTAQTQTQRVVLL